MDRKNIATQRDQFPIAHARHPPPPVRPVASGSHVLLDVAAGEMQSDTEYDTSDAVESDAELPIPLHLRGSIGTHDSRFDADGDFYGRGKDSFVGPTADSGEYVTKTLTIYAFLILHFSQY
jgi:hypothetical protein